MATFNLNINGKKQQVDVDPATPMLWVLRDHLNLVGTKYGCGIAQCGACTIHLGDVATRSCVLPVSAIGAQSITTIEGLSEKGDHPVQKAWLEHDAPQCGYCQAGQIMTAAALLKSNGNPSDEEIEAAYEWEHLPLCYLHAHQSCHPYSCQIFYHSILITLSFSTMESVKPTINRRSF
jgi:isoquinoline 1-oxidoreductase alpha subunit